MAELRGINYQSDQIEDPETYDLLPTDVKQLVEDLKGVVAYQGGLHIRGCVRDPQWHSLYDAWKGDNAYHKYYSELRATDIPFAEDCLGDQYFWRLGTVWSLMCETGDVEDTELDVFEFLDAIVADPIEFLSMEPLIVYLEQNEPLEAQQTLHVEPSFLTESDHYEFKPVDRIEQRKYLIEQYKLYCESEG